MKVKASHLQRGHSTIELHHQTDAFTPWKNTSNQGMGKCQPRLNIWLKHLHLGKLKINFLLNNPDKLSAFRQRRRSSTGWVDSVAKNPGGKQLNCFLELIKPWLTWAMPLTQGFSRPSVKAECPSLIPCIFPRRPAREHTRSYPACWPSPLHSPSCFTQVWPYSFHDGLKTTLRGTNSRI